MKLWDCEKESCAVLRMDEEFRCTRVGCSFAAAQREDDIANGDEPAPEQSNRLANWLARRARKEMR